jgi:hypothetical protein
MLLPLVVYSSSMHINAAAFVLCAGTVLVVALRRRSPKTRTDENIEEEIDMPADEDNDVETSVSAGTRDPLHQCVGQHSVNSSHSDLYRNISQPCVLVVVLLLVLLTSASFLLPKPQTSLNVISTHSYTPSDNHSLSYSHSHEFSNASTHGCPAAGASIGAEGTPTDTATSSLIGAYYDNNSTKITPLRDLFFSLLSVQHLFDQGLLLLHGFNQAEAIRNFESALIIDPTCFMCHWAIAQASRMNLNVIMGESMYLKGKTSIEKAQKNFLQVNSQRSQNVLLATQLHFIAELLNATSMSFAPTMELFRAHGSAHYEPFYSHALRSLYEQVQEKQYQQQFEHNSSALAALDFSGYGFVTDVGIFLAESLLNLTPWKYYVNVDHRDTAGAGGEERLYVAGLRTVRMNSRALESLGILEKLLCLELEPSGAHVEGAPTSAPEPAPAEKKAESCDHPLGLHLYIHLLEQTDNPRIALPSAHRLSSE